MKALSRIEQALVVAAYFRGGRPDDPRFTVSCTEVINLSLFYTGDITSKTCEERFLRSPVPYLYDDTGRLNESILERYGFLIALIKKYPALIESGGNIELPADPSYTGCRLTQDGIELAKTLIPLFSEKPTFPERPDRRSYPE